MAYIGQSLTEGTRREYTYVATAAQTTFNAVYTVGAVDVYQNGVLLAPADYTATDGTTVVLNSGAALNDEITIHCHNTFSVADTVSASQGGTFNGPVSVTGTFTSRGIDDNATSTAMTLDASGNLLVGTISNDNANDGARLKSYGQLAGTTNSDISLVLNRRTSDGDIAQFRKDNSVVGSIGSRAGVVSTLILDPRTSSGTGVGITGANQNTIMPTDAGGNLEDAAIDLGDGFTRFRNLYLSGGVYLGGTGAANKLDDYEEGTWTPYLNGSVSLGTANYTKIGQLVYCEIKAYNVNISSIGTTTGLYISGAPFTAATYQYSMPCAQQGGVSFGIYDATGSNLYLGVGTSAVDYTSVNRNTFGGGTNMSFRFSFTYRTSA